MLQRHKRPLCKSEPLFTAKRELQDESEIHDDEVKCKDHRTESIFSPNMMDEHVFFKEMEWEVHLKEHQAIRNPEEKDRYIFYLHLTVYECDQEIPWIIVRKKSFLNCSIWKHCAKGCDFLYGFCPFFEQFHYFIH